MNKINKFNKNNNKTEKNQPSKVVYILRQKSIGQHQKVKDRERKKDKKEIFNPKLGLLCEKSQLCKIS